MSSPTPPNMQPQGQPPVVKKTSVWVWILGGIAIFLFAITLACDPGFVMLDEPFAGVDPHATDEIGQMIHQMAARGIGVLITDHNVRDALDIIDRAYIIHEGQVLKEGTPDDIVGDRDVRRVYLGERFQL